MSSIFNWFQFFLCSKQDVSVTSATPGVVSAEGCVSLFHKDTILELSLAQLTPVLHLNLQMSTLLLSQRQQEQRLLPSTKYYGQIGQRLPLPTTGAAEELVPTRDTHPHIWPTGLCSLFLCYIVASCFAYILDVAQRSCIKK